VLSGILAPKAPRLQLQVLQICDCAPIVPGGEASRRGNLACTTDLRPGIYVTFRCCHAVGEVAYGFATICSLRSIMHPGAARQA